MKLIKYNGINVQKIYSPLNNFFSKIYYINMSIATDRNQKMIELFKKYNIEAFRFEAIVPTEKGPYKNEGTRGCLLSHWEIIKKAKSENLDNVLIFEDDVEFIPEFNLKIIPILEQLKKEPWDMIYFGTCGKRITEKKEYNQYLDRLFRCWCLHSYAIKYTVYNDLIELFENNNGEAVDNLYPKIFDKINVFVSKPELCHQISGFSYIKNKYKNWEYDRGI